MPAFLPRVLPQLLKQHKYLAAVQGHIYACLGHFFAHTWIMAQFSDTAVGSSGSKCLHTGGASAMNGIAPIRPSHFGAGGIR